MWLIFQLALCKQHNSHLSGFFTVIPLYSGPSLKIPPLALLNSNLHSRFSCTFFSSPCKTKSCQRVSFFLTLDFSKKHYPHFKYGHGGEFLGSAMLWENRFDSLSAIRFRHQVCCLGCCWLYTACSQVKCGRDSAERAEAQNSGRWQKTGRVTGERGVSPCSCLQGDLSATRIDTVTPCCRLSDTHSSSPLPPLFATPTRWDRRRGQATAHL